MALRCPVRVVAVFNPSSGTGHARRVAILYADHLRSRGFRVDLCHSHGTACRDSTPFADAAPHLLQDDVVLVAGGDGTVHRLLPTIVDSGAALCQLPAGTENLFSREFGAPRSPESVERALCLGTRRRVDLGDLAGTPFALMASIGPDAGVIRRLDAGRAGPISHLSYFKPILREFLDPSLPLLSVSAQGQPWITARRGMLVIANSRHYAWRLDPCRLADPADGQLDAVFLPGDTAPDMARWALVYLMTNPAAIPRGALCRRAVHFSIQNHTAPSTSSWQADGEVALNATQHDQRLVQVGVAEYKLLLLVCS